MRITWGAFKIYCCPGTIPARQVKSGSLVLAHGCGDFCKAPCIILMCRAGLLIEHIPGQDRTLASLPTVHTLYHCYNGDLLQGNTSFQTIQMNSFCENEI